MVVKGDSGRGKNLVKSYLFIKPTSVLNLNFGLQCRKNCFLKKNFSLINNFLIIFRLKLQIFYWIRFKL